MKCGFAVPIIMKGYYRDAAKTAEAMQGEWFRTGDLGFIRPDGNLVITGRSKDVIVLTSGEKVYPEEMEAHYSQSRPHQGNLPVRRAAGTRPYWREPARDRRSGPRRVSPPGRDSDHGDDPF